jgi:hypothetical protein
VTTPDHDRPAEMKLDVPILGEHPVIHPWHHRHRWVLFLFAAAVLALAVYVGWRIVEAWDSLMERFNVF